MRNVRLGFVAAILTALLSVSAAAAQTETLRLTLTRDFGYSGFSNDIQGTFTLHAGAPADVVRVQFYIDETLIGTDDTAPFSLQFVTDNFSLGAHNLSATGYASSGQTLRSNTIPVVFVSASAGGQAALRIVLPVLAVVFAAMILAAVVPLLVGRKTKPVAPGTQRAYTFGGAVCPRCKRPFPFPFLAMNLPGSKVTRCPNCGRWGIFGYASLDRLRAAERAEMPAAPEQLPPESAEEKLKKELDDSRFHDL
jgi:hypothetical protein